MSTLEMTYGSDTVTVELGMPEDPILVDGEDFGRQCADGSCRTEDCMRIAARHCWGPVYETEQDAIDAGKDPTAVCLWEDVAYTTLGESDMERIAREDSERDDACTACQLLGCTRGSLCGLAQVEVAS